MGRGPAACAEQVHAVGKPVEDPHISLAMQASAVASSVSSAHATCTMGTHVRSRWTHNAQRATLVVCGCLGVRAPQIVQDLDVQGERCGGSGGQLLHPRMGIGADTPQDVVLTPGGNKRANSPHLRRKPMIPMRCGGSRPLQRARRSALKSHSRPEPRHRKRSPQLRRASGRGEWMRHLEQTGRRLRRGFRSDRRPPATHVPRRERT